MSHLQMRWTRRITPLLMAAVAAGWLLPDSAEAQIFRGRIRNWLRGGSPVERIPADEAVIIERGYFEPRIVLPGEADAGYQREAEARYREGNDYGPGVSERVRRERGFATGRRRSRSYEELETRDPRPARSLDERRSVLRTPSDRWQAEDRDGDYAIERPRVAGERTVRIDEFENSARVRPPEDPLEPAAERTAGSRAGAQERQELELGDARGPRRSEALLEEPPSPPEPRPRTDDRVRPASAEKAETKVDEFDLPRSKRDETSPTKSAAPEPPAKDDREAITEEAELLPPPPDTP